jgi:DNA-binding response OmpR family regulator
MTKEKTVLIIDDDAMIRMVLRNMLKKEGYKVEEAAEGGAGMIKFLETAPALVLCDRLMPEGVSGFDFLKQLRALPSSVPFVFLTSLTDPRDRMAITDFDVADYLEKPIAPDVLRACLHRILGPAQGE